MRNSFSLVTVLLCVLFFVTSCSKKDDVNLQTIDFELLAVPSAGYWNGSDATGSFTSSDMKFYNQYNAAWSSWSGFSYSQKNDITSAGFENEFSVVDPANLKNKFALFYPSFDGDVFAQFANNQDYTIRSIDLCNSTYAALSMRNGNAFSKKFGGTTGTDPDWFKVTITGYDHNNKLIGSKEVYLADFRFADSSNDFILNKWTTVDLTSLGKVNKITFTFASSDTGAYGINTPTYVCMDNIRYIMDNVNL
jgi:hypothetical protein